MLSNDITERSPQRMSTDSFLILRMGLSDLIKELKTPTYPWINSIYTKDNLCIRKEIRFFFCISSSITDDTDFFLMIEINTVEKRIIAWFKIEITNLIRSFFGSKIGKSCNLGTELILQRKGDRPLYSAILDEGKQCSLRSRRKGFYGRLETLHFTFFWEGIRKKLFPFLKNILWPCLSPLTNLLHLWIMIKSLKYSNYQSFPSLQPPFFVH